MKAKINLLLEHFEDHVFLLEAGLRNYRNNRAWIKVIALSLRVLMVKTSGDIDLFFYLCDKFNFKPMYQKRISFRPEKFQDLSFFDYLDTFAMKDGDDEYSKRDVIKFSADKQGSTHVFVSKNKFNYMTHSSPVVGGIPVNNRVLIGIGNLTLSQCNKLLEHIKSNYTQEEINSISTDENK